MRATLILADYAQVADGKLNLIGGGWKIVGPEPMPYALAVLVEVPWDRTNEKHQVRLELLDADARPVVAPHADGGEGPVVIEAEFELGRPPGVKLGVAMNFPMAVNLPPHPLAPGAAYEWRLWINGATDDDWRVVFTTRPAQG